MRKFEFVRRPDVSFGQPRHWYFITTYYCPVCGREKIYRERRLGRRPKDNRVRHGYEMRSFCGCDL